MPNSNSSIIGTWTGGADVALQSFRRPPNTHPTFQNLDTSVSHTISKTNPYSYGYNKKIISFGTR